MAGDGSMKELSDLSPTEEAYAALQVAYDHFNKLFFEGKLPGVVFVFSRRKHVLGHYCKGRFGSKRDQGRAVDEIALNPESIALHGTKGILSTVLHEMLHQIQEVEGTASRAVYHNEDFARRSIEVGLMPSDTGRPGGKKTGQNVDQYIIGGGPFCVAADALIASGFDINWYDLYPSKAFVSSDGLSGTYCLPKGEVLPESSEEIEKAAPPRSEETNIRVTPVDGVTGRVEVEGVVVNIGQLPPGMSPAKKSKTCYQCPKCSAKVWGKPGLGILCKADNIEYVEQVAAEEKLAQ